ncbi:BsaWI family type II restriction enzyme [Geminocystis sp. GBBB08]|uniref:BsaWI family type II restriction enzyme n=1 Tax=Geminocystis sp. GBBB08 TaxID=2604140 RepID=UPI0027E27762|nr:BsaWI family type II restriction enzyme [Geminocystis sp. GBBB08]
MIPILKQLDKYIAKYGLEKSLDYLNTILNSAKDDIEILLDKRILEGEIKDKSQARKSIAGNTFSLLIKYLFITLKENQLIKTNIFITSNPKKHKLISDIVTIKVDDETQKPNMDLAIYSINEKNTLNKCLILSLKISLNKYPEQICAWKLLLEIATSDNPIKEKYNISYEHKTMPLVGFATVNFYDEINNPQHRGMFKFFDIAFIGKPLNAGFINNLSDLPRFVNENL